MDYFFVANEQNYSAFTSAVQTPTAENNVFLFQLFSGTFVMKKKGSLGGAGGKAVSPEHVVATCSAVLGTP